MALSYIFIFIRSEPENPIHKEIIGVFLNWLHKDIKFGFCTIRVLVYRLYKIRNDPYRNRVIAELTSFFVKTGKFNMDRINMSVEPIINILEEINKKIELREFNKVRIMASSVHNYPSFILGTYYGNSKEFWNENINYYNREFGEGFMSEWEYLFQEVYSKTDKDIEI
ncbi:hypothetical protein [Paenibacillus sp. UNC451MF]|uniref:hypothetical protein n=1 Tax=Paenibacillus sp. UNC451MF TaxID=1449063 RepID=UPI000563FEC4|nr:hypothetical protein [Paenibacillus sp. UNC451MF]